MKFVHTYISTKSKVPTLSDIVKAAQTKAAMASTPATTKTASVAKTAGRGNVANFGDKKAKPFGKKDEEVEIEVEAEIEVPAKKTKKASKEEGESSGQPEAEAKLVNEPKKPEGDKAKSGGGKKGSDSDEAESSGQLDVEPLHQEGESTGKKPGGLDTQKSSSSKGWLRIANLTSEQESKVREELEKFWPKKFVDALLAKR